jgi:hypothetical protein
MPGLFCALYGRKSKQDGFMAAHAYAERHGLEFTVIDLSVGLSMPINPEKMTAEELGHHDFLPLTQAKNEVWDQVGAAIGDDGDGRTMLRESPALISKFLDGAAGLHLGLVAFDSKPAIASQTLVVGLVPHRNWRKITSAICRLDPATMVTLERPDIEASGSSRDMHRVNLKVGLKISSRGKRRE